MVHKSFFENKIPRFFSVGVIVAAVVVFYYRILDNPIVFDTAQTFSDQVLNDYFEKFQLLTIRSLNNLSFGATYKLVGMNWYWHHWINILIHATNGILILLFLNKLFSLFIIPQENQTGIIHHSWFALFGTLLFALHPISEYGTAYLIERSIQLATLFGLATLLAMMQGMIKKQYLWFVAAAFFYFVAVHCKEHSILVPGVGLLLMLMLWRQQLLFQAPTTPASKSQKPLIVFVLAVVLLYLAFALIAAQITWKGQASLGQVYEAHGVHILQNISADAPDNTAMIAHPYLMSVITQGHMFFRYLFLWLVPYLPWIYIDIQLPSATNFFCWPETFGFVCYFLYGALGFWFLTRRGAKVLLGFGMLFPWVLFGTEFSVARLSEQFVLYRSYLWFSGFFAILPWLFSWRLGEKPLIQLKALLMGLWVVIVVVLAFDRLKTFDSQVMVWTDTIEKLERLDPRALYKSYRPYNNLAFAYTGEGDIEKAILYFQKALQLNPRYVKARSNLGAVLTNKGRYEEAIENFKIAIGYDPEYVDAYVGLGVCAAEMGFYEEAVQYYKQALKISPKYFDANFDLANAYLKLNMFPEAANHYEQALMANPQYIDGHYNLSIVYSKMGDFANAIKACDKALAINPKHAKVNQLCSMIKSTTILQPTPIVPMPQPPATEQSSLQASSTAESH